MRRPIPTASLSPLQEFDPSVKEAAAWAIGYIAQHTAGEDPRIFRRTRAILRRRRLRSTDPTSAALSSRDTDLAQNVLDAGTVPLLVLCLQEPEITLKRVSASAMSDVCKHTPELAQAVVDAGAVKYLSPLIVHPDSKLKRQVGERVLLAAEGRHESRVEVVWSQRRGELA